MRACRGVSKCLISRRFIVYIEPRLEYSFTVPHDMETLVEFMGGATTFESRLDLMVGLSPDF
jgi:putative alpha-1,2-mannosidase